LIALVIRWLGHSCFYIETSSLRILTDPYDATTGYKASFPEVDIVLVSHEHNDHNAVKKVKGYKKVIKDGVEEVDGVRISSVPYFHDNAQGSKRGKISMFRIEADGLNLAFLSDLGTLLTQKELDALGNVNIAFLPVGGFFTIGPDEAWQVVDQLKPNIVIPMHYKTKNASLFLKMVLKDLKAFVKDHPYEEPNVLEITAETLPQPTQIVALTFNPMAQ
jgi:L-ascorbate metabolism protein UlaG (beta-lactamase superfamily)